MSEFIKLTGYNGDPIVLNVDNIVSVVSGRDFTLVSTDLDDRFEVREGVITILDTITNHRDGGSNGNT